MRAADIFSKQASRAAETDWSAKARAAARAAETKAVAAACHLVAPPPPYGTLPPRAPPKGLPSRGTSACGLLSALVRGAWGCIDAPMSARGVSASRVGPRPRASATHRCDGAPCVAATPALPPPALLPPALAATCDRSHATTQAAEAARRYTASHEEAGRRRGSWGGGGSGAGGGAAGGAAAPSAALSELGLGDVPPHALTPAQAQRACPKASPRERRSYPAGPAVPAVPAGPAVPAVPGPTCLVHSLVNHETPAVSHPT